MSHPYFPRRDEARDAAIATGLHENEFEIVSGPKGFTYRKKRQYKKVKDAKLHVGPESQVPLSPEQSKLPDPTAKSAEVEEVIALTAEKRLCSGCNRPVDTFISGDDLRYIEHHDPNFSGDSTSLCNMSEEIVVNVSITGAAPTEFKPHELAQIQNGAVESAADEIYRQTHNERGEKITKELPRLHKSLIANPTKVVWTIADDMMKEDPTTSRKDVIERCLGMGIAFFTARTQYQQWKTARKESQEHAALAPVIKIR